MRLKKVGQKQEEGKRDVQRKTEKKELNEDEEKKEREENNHMIM